MFYPTIFSARGACAILLFVSTIAATKSSPAPSAISIPPTQYWDGIDGKWSTFGIQVGTPAQQFRVLPMTQEGSIWVVLPDGCTPDDGVKCKDNRGELLGLDRTTTWQQKGLYNLSLIEESMLGYEGAGLYGHDAAALGWPGNNLPALEKAIIAGIATKDFYMGGMPLNPWPVNFTTLTDSTPSLMSALKNASKIPSLTYGYTAGYYGNNPPIFGSLTLGGYDTNRFAGNGVEFVMGADISRDLLVAIQSIKSGSTDLLSQPIYAFVDSAVPTIWLPMDACQKFEKAFNLIWDAETESYLVNETLHNQLVAENPTVSFQIGPQGTGDSVTIDMPYGAFDLNRLNTTYAPLPSNQSRYFPLKRADDPAKYTLGRAFLQNAYIIANYEFFNFSIHQATYPGSNVGVNLVTLGAETTGKQTFSGLKIGAIIGIAVGGGAALILLGLLVIYLCCIKKRKEVKDLKNSQLHDFYGKGELDTFGTTIYEARGKPLHRELEGHHHEHEMDANDTAIESNKPTELPAHEFAAEVHSEGSTPHITPSATPGPNVASPSNHSQIPTSSPHYSSPNQQYGRPHG